MVTHLVDFFWSMKNFVIFIYTCKIRREEIQFWKILCCNINFSSTRQNSITQNPLHSLFIHVEKTLTALVIAPKIYVCNIIKHYFKTFSSYPALSTSTSHSAAHTHKTRVERRSAYYQKLNEGEEWKFVAFLYTFNGGGKRVEAQSRRVAYSKCKWILTWVKRAVDTVFVERQQLQNCVIKHSRFDNFTQHRRVLARERHWRSQVDSM